MSDKRSGWHRYSWSLAIGLAAVLCTSMARKRETLPESARRVATIERIIDGDSFVLATGERIRLIGVDAPELPREDSPAEYFALESKEFLKSLLRERELALNSPPQGRDRYGRTLAYAYIDDTLMVNMEIIRQGFAFVYTRYPFRYAESFREVQRAAREDSRGLWGRRLEADSNGVIDALDARKHFGQRVIAEGTIVRTHCSRRACFLSFSKDWRNHLTAVIFSQNLHKFPDSPHQHYLGKRVRIIGWVRKYKGSPQIVLSDATEIQVIE